MTYGEAFQDVKPIDDYMNFNISFFNEFREYLKEKSELERKHAKESDILIQKYLQKLEKKKQTLNLLLNPPNTISTSVENSPILESKQQTPTIQSPHISLAQSNKEYFTYLTKLKDTEESKESFMTFFFEKIDNFIKNKIKIIDKFETQINSVIPNQENEKKIKEKTRILINEQLNNFVLDPEKNLRIKNEEFIEYEEYKTQLSNLINRNRMYLKEDTKNNRINFNPQEMLINTIIEKKSKKKEEYIFNKEENNLIENIFLLEEIDTFKASQLIEKNKK